MKKLIPFIVLSLFFTRVWATDYTTTITLPANYAVGDYVEFVSLGPIDAAASGYYEISISYTRNNLAAASTHIASVSHANPAMWREAGRVNHNAYTTIPPGLTIDCNTDNANPRLRLRVVLVQGDPLQALPVNIKVRSINFNSAYWALNVTGNDPSAIKFLPMSSEWSLYVGHLRDTDGAKIALRALENGNVLIGKALQGNSSYKLDVAGKIRADEIVVNTTGADFVFEEGYKVRTLKELENFIKTNKHLPDIPPARIMQEQGVGVSELQTKLLQKIEELTLYLIDMKKENEELKRRVEHIESKKR